MSKLASQQCVPCSRGTPPLSAEEQERLQRELDPAWRVVDGHHLERGFGFEDFRQALDFTVQIGELAEAQGHHPDLHLGWGKVGVSIWTHKIDGLSESDFVLAAKIDELSQAAGR